MKPTIVTALLAVVATVACATGAEAGVLTAMNLREPPGRLAASLDGAHTCFVPSDGTVRCWGRNEFGQIGNGGGPGDQPVPAMVSGIATAVAVTVGRDHTCALHASGVVQCWGSNASGQLGVGAGTASSNTPLTRRHRRDIDLRRRAPHVRALVHGTGAVLGQQRLRSDRRPVRHRDALLAGLREQCLQRRRGDCRPQPHVCTARQRRRDLLGPEQ